MSARRSDSWARSLPRCARLGVAVLVVLSAFGPAPEANADPRSDYLVRMLRTSSSFRVRTQAALSLARVEPDAAVMVGLGDALGDEHPAVRAAAATALEQIENPDALPALERHRRDRDPAVRRTVLRAIATLEQLARTRPRSAPVPRETPTGGRYYVGVATPSASDRSIDREILTRAAEFLRTELGAMDGVVVAPERETPAAAERAIRAAGLTGYYLEASVVRIEVRPDGVRAVVSLILNTYPGRDMRAILNGAATVQGGGDGASARRQAVQGAFSGALRRLPQALEAADARDGG
jgi:hypothetical protein